MTKVSLKTIGQNDNVGMFSDALPIDSRKHYHREKYDNRY